MAGRIPQSFIDDLLHRVDIIDLIDAKVPLKKAGKEYKACCPFHAEKTPSFTVSPTKQFYHCFGCGEHGSAIGFLMQYEHLGFVEAVEELASKLGIEVPYENNNFSQNKPSAENQQQSLNIYQLLDKANTFYQQQLLKNESAKKAIIYLKNRGLDGRTAKKFEIGFAPNEWDSCLKALGGKQHDIKLLHQAGLIIKRDNKIKSSSAKNSKDSFLAKDFYDRFRDRIIFPIKDTRNRTIAFGGRLISGEAEKQPKYLNSPETPVYHKGRELFALNLAAAQIKEQGFVFVVEGYMDVIILSQYGIENVVATLGTALTVGHVEKLFKYTDEIVCCFDGDRAGKQAAWRALENVVASIKDKRTIRFLFLPEGEDPDSMVSKEGKDAFLARTNKALSFSEMLLSRVKKNSNATNEIRFRLAAEVIPYIEKIEDGVIKDILKQELGRYTGSDILHHLETKTISKLPRSNQSNKFSFSQPRQNSYQNQGNINRADSKSNAFSNAEVRNADGARTQEIDAKYSSFYMIASRAVQLLLQYPKFYKEIEGSEIDGLTILDDITVTLLLDIHRQLRLNESEKGINTGILLERYREHPYHQLLDKLASQTYLIEDEEQLAKEFVKLVYMLIYKSVDKEISELIQVESRISNSEYILEQLKKLYEKRKEIKQKWLS